jgi:hypothetical protein
MRRVSTHPAQKDRQRVGNRKIYCRARDGWRARLSLDQHLFHMCYTVGSRSRNWGTSRKVRLTSTVERLIMLLRMFEEIS